MTRLQKCLFATLCVIVIFSTVLNAMLKEWDNIILIWCITFMLYELFRLMSIMQMQDMMIDRLTDLCSDSNVARLEKENNFLVENIKHYLKSIEVLKANLKHYQTLSKNLMENNSNKGVKNYGRKKL